jgi:hypothetical protein
MVAPTLADVLDAMKTLTADMATLKAEMALMKEKVHVLVRRRRQAPPEGSALGPSAQA